VNLGIVFETGVIPAGINRYHVLAALSQIDREGVPSSRQNRSIALRYSGKSFPPKLVLSVASEIASGEPLASSAFITTEAERFLTRLGFSVIRTKETDLGGVEQKRSARLPALGYLSLKELEELGKRLVYSSPLYRWSELRNNPTLPPRSAGVYGLEDHLLKTLGLPPPKP
jgi:hypothetical protein